MRWNVSQLSTLPAIVSGRARHSGFVLGAQLVDNVAFAISPAEAIAMDPSQRLLLERAYASLHDAALDRAMLSGSLSGVFIAFGGGDFGHIVATSSELQGSANVFAVRSGFEESGQVLKFGFPTKNLLSVR